MAGAGIGHAAESATSRPAPQSVQGQTGGSAQIEHGAQAENWSKSEIEQVQRELKAAGAYNGPIDGQLDTKTENALSQFQEQHGLQKTGMPDRQTLAALDRQSNGTGSSATPGMQPSHSGNDNGAGSNSQSR
jgi:peptidoglycan hydrolase-like protein with peptidoglycan-binding domain